MSVELNSTLALSAPQPVTSPQEEAPKKVEQKSETEVKVSRISQEVIEAQVEILTKNPEMTILGLLFKQLALSVSFPAPEPEGSSLKEQSCRCSQTWSLISLKTLQGVFARKAELEKVEIVCPEETVTPENFVSVITTIRNAKRPAEGAIPLEQSTEVCMKVWTEEQNRAFEKVFGTAYVHFYQQLAELPLVIDALQKAQVTLPSITEENLVEIREKTNEVMGQIMMTHGNEKGKEKLKPMESLLKTLSNDCAKALHTEEAETLYTYVQDKEKTS